MTMSPPKGSYKRENSRILLFLICIFQTISFDGFSFQQQSNDSIIFYEYDGASYRASSFNHVGEEDEDGILYFGNDNGLLEFDGTHWQLYQKPDFSPVAQLKIVGDKIFVYGADEIGYYQRNEIGRMMYHPLGDNLEREKISYVLYIAEKDGNVYFST